MSKKLVYALIAVFICTSMISAFAQTTAAEISAGNKFTYSTYVVVAVGDSSSNYSALNKTKQVEIIVNGTDGLTVSYTQILDFIDGTSQKGYSNVIANSYNDMFFVANLSVNEPLFNQAITAPLNTTVNPIVNETITKNVLQTERTINHATWNVSYTTYKQGDTSTLVIIKTIYQDVYFDKITGVPITSQIINSVFDSDGNLTTQIISTKELTSSNCWTIQPSPTPTDEPTSASSQTPTSNPSASLPPTITTATTPPNNLTETTALGLPIAYLIVIIVVVVVVGVASIIILKKRSIKP